MPYASKQAKADALRRWRQSGTPASLSYHEREHTRNAHRTRIRPHKVPLFLCIDGELSISSERRYYNVVQFYADPGCGETPGLWTLTDALGVGIIAFAHRLRSLVSMLRKRYPSRKIVPVWFAGQFDADQMIGSERSFSLEDMALLVSTHGSRYGSVRDRSFRDVVDIEHQHIGLRWGRKTLQIDYLTDRDSNGSNDRIHDNLPTYKRQRIVVTDVWSITARSFVKTITDICMPHWTPEQRAEYLPLLDLIEQGKEARQYADWRGWDSATIERYNRAELVLLGNYCDTLWTFCESTDIYPRSFAGPAPFARALQRAYQITAHIKPDDYDTIEFQEGVIHRHELDSYYGGRIENLGQGWVDRLYEYDIRSAYPDAERRAPCLAHGLWRILTPLEIRQANEGSCVPSDIGTYEIQWWIPEGRGDGDAGIRWGPLPVRDGTGRVSFPTAGRGWYKGIEIQALMDCFPGDWCLFAGQVWDSTCELEHPRAKMIEETYAKRAALKQQGDGAELVLKLALNAGYGVTAQTAGAYREIDENGQTTAYHTPKTANITLAAWDTAYVRARIYRALVSGDTVAAATDAVYSLSPNPYCESSGLDTDGQGRVDDGVQVSTLGTWEQVQHNDPALLVAPGLIVSQTDMVKKRGIGGRVDAAALVAAWDRDSSDPDFTYHLTQQRYKDLRASLHCKDGSYTLDDDWGEFLTLSRDLNLTPSILASKRDTAMEFLTHPPHEFTFYPPYAGGRYSVGYRRPFDTDYRQNAVMDALSDEAEGNMYAI